jgi:hypothetical protein
MVLMATQMCHTIQSGQFNAVHSFPTFTTDDFSYSLPKMQLYEKESSGIPVMSLLTADAWYLFRLSQSSVVPEKILVFPGASKCSPNGQIVYCIDRTSEEVVWSRVSVSGEILESSHPKKIQLEAPGFSIIGSPFVADHYLLDIISRNETCTVILINTVSDSVYIDNLTTRPAKVLTYKNYVVIISYDDVLELYQIVDNKLKYTDKFYDDMFDSAVIVIRENCILLPNTDETVTTLCITEAGFAEPDRMYSS